MLTRMPIIGGALDDVCDAVGGRDCVVPATRAHATASGILIVPCAIQRHLQASSQSLA